MEITSEEAKEIKRFIARTNAEEAKHMGDHERNVRGGKMEGRGKERERKGKRKRECTCDCVPGDLLGVKEQYTSRWQMM